MISNPFTGAGYLFRGLGLINRPGGVEEFHRVFPYAAVCFSILPDKRRNKFEERGLNTCSLFIITCNLSFYLRSSARICGQIFFLFFVRAPPPTPPREGRCQF